MKSHSIYNAINTETETLMAGVFEFHIDVYYPSNRADLDNSLKNLLRLFAAL